jgi:ribosomal protein L14
MTQIKFLLGLLCAYAAYYTTIIMRDQKRQKQLAAKVTENTAEKEEVPQVQPLIPQERRVDKLLVHDTVVRSLYAYDNSDHKQMVHVRFDAQTVDLLNKFKMATGTDITKFVAFAVKYLFESNPELKNIIKLYLQNTKL